MSVFRFIKGIAISSVMFVVAYIITILLVVLITSYVEVSVTVLFVFAVCLCGWLYAKHG